ncbi:alpha/beta hydrolase [Fictibacillus iocasae]|uniref:Alpha/beta hydrolase n=1 Tax=Fictibacillus iocasae TaxID=2715437 RepID=A0ABW2NM64_9BACL
MNLNGSRGSITGYKGLDVPYTLLSVSEDASSLAVILPGLGYSAEGPLLHYATGVALHHNCDVLHVNYRYSSDDYRCFSIQEIDEALQQDSLDVLADVLCSRKYNSYFLIGKSIGTIAMAALLKNEPFSSAETVWLTPLLHENMVLESMLSTIQDGLVFIGSDDRHYSADAVEKIMNRGRLECTIAEGANHSYEYSGDTMRTIDLLKQTISKIEGMFKR